MKIVLLADELVCGAHGRNNESAGLMVVCCVLSAQFVRAGQNSPSFDFLRARSRCVHDRRGVDA